MAGNLTYRDFAKVEEVLKILPQKSEEYWLSSAKRNAYGVFRLLKSKVLAYRKFLKAQGMGLATLRDPQDFEKIPLMTKENYLKKYPYEEVLAGKPEEVKSFYMSSGTTGEPSIWPRLPEADKAYAVMVNFFYTVYWGIDKLKTLYISAMDLGIWASGNLQFNAATYCARRHKFTFANPGADFTYVYKILKNLARYYDLVIIATYPSVARRLLDVLLEEKDLDLKKVNLRFMLGGEAHTIEWRHYVLEKMGLPATCLHGVLDYYGTSDSGGPGSSTPLTALLQNLCKENSRLCRDLFGQVVVPSLFQRNPFLHVEAVEGQIVVTYPGQIPLCRYDSGDTGGVLRFSEVMERVGDYGYDVEALLAKEGFGGMIWKWPFIYLTGRSDAAVSIGGALVYPKDIEGVFFKEDSKEINSFKIGIEYTRDKRQKLVVYLELKENCKLTEERTEKLKQKYEKATLEGFLGSNPDYYGSYFIEPEALRPHIKVYEYGWGVFKDESKRHKPNFVKK